MQPRGGGHTSLRSKSRVRRLYMWTGRRSAPGTRPARSGDPIEFSHGDSHDPVQRSGVPVGLLRDAGAERAALALPRPARLAPGDDRVARRHRRPAFVRLHAGTTGCRIAALPRPLRDALRGGSADTAGCDRPRVPGRRRDAVGTPGPRVRGTAGARVRVVHEPAPARRGRGDPERARRCRRCRRGGRRRGARLARGQRGLRGRQVQLAQRRRRRDRVPGQGGGQRRPRSLHGAVGRLRTRRAPPRGRRLPAARGLRRPDREPRPDARALRAPGGAARAACVLQRGPVHAGGRGRARRQPDRRRPPRRRGCPARARRRRPRDARAARRRRDLARRPSAGRADATPRGAA